MTAALPLAARDPAELGRQTRLLLWRFAGRTRLRGVPRDQAAVALVRNRLPATRGVLSGQALGAVLRELAPIPARGAP